MEEVCVKLLSVCCEKIYAICVWKQNVVCSKLNIRVVSVVTYVDEWYLCDNIVEDWWVAHFCYIIYLNSSDIVYHACVCVRACV